MDPVVSNALAVVVGKSPVAPPSGTVTGRDVVLPVPPLNVDVAGTLTPANYGTTVVPTTPAAQAADAATGKPSVAQAQDAQASAAQQALQRRRAGVFAGVLSTLLVLA